MSKWKNIKTYMEVNPYTGQPVEEDAPTNATGVAVAGTGDDSSVVVVRKKKKTLIDARSKSYRQHRERLEKARAKREERKSKLAQKVAEDTLKFEREKHLEEAELDEVRISDYVVDTLRDIKRSKSSRNLKLKGGDIKIDTDTANKMLDFLDNMTSPMGKRKIVDILDKGTKKDFMKVNQAVMKAVR